LAGHYLCFMAGEWEISSYQLNDYVSLLLLFLLC